MRSLRRLGFGLVAGVLSAVVLALVILPTTRDTEVVSSASEVAASEDGGSNEGADAGLPDLGYPGARVLDDGSLAPFPEKDLPWETQVAENGDTYGRIPSDPTTGETDYAKTPEFILVTDGSKKTDEIAGFVRREHALCWFEGQIPVFAEDLETRIGFVSSADWVFLWNDELPAEANEWSDDPAVEPTICGEEIRRFWFPK